ncbi:MAG: hypothetical protein ACRDGS_10815 [Chloroflexota bacterium]
MWQWSLPTTHRQTPAWFRSAFGPQWSAFAWGADLGLGWTTYVTFSGYYGLVLWALLLSSPVHGSMIVGAYGLGRALPVVGAGLGCHRDLGLAHLGGLRFLKVVNAAVLTLVAGYFLVGWIMLCF